MFYISVAKAGEGGEGTSDTPALESRFFINNINAIFFLSPCELSWQSVRLALFPVHRMKWNLIPSTCFSAHPLQRRSNYFVIYFINHLMQYLVSSPFQWSTPSPTAIFCWLKGNERFHWSLSHKKYIKMSLRSAERKSTDRAQISNST